MDRKEQILSIATELFSVNGYSATSVRDIAEKAQIEAPSLYNHISSKEEILQIICFSLAGKFINAIDEVNDIYFDAEKKLRMAIQNHVEILTNNLPQSIVFLYEWRRLGPDNLKKFIQLRDQYEKSFITILEDGEKENLFQEVDKKFAALNILASVNWIVEWYKPDGKMSPAEISEKLSDFILSGLNKKKPY